MLRRSLLLLAFLAVGCGDEGPAILHVTELSNTTSEVGPYGVWATVADDREVKRVELRWRFKGAAEEPLIVMTSLGGQVWYGEIPGQPAGSVIEWYVAATDGTDDGVVTAPAEYAKTPYSFAVVAP